MAQSHQGSLWGTSVSQQGGIEGPEEEGQVRRAGAENSSSPAGGLSPSPGEVRARWGRGEVGTQEASDNRRQQTPR